MGRDENRFASDGVFHALTRPARAVVLGRLINPRALGLAPARLVAVIDATIQDALEESPTILWETEETIRFELPEARVLLSLADADVPGAAGLALGVVFEGENAAEIARALSRLILRTIEMRYPAFAPDPAIVTLEDEAMAILAEPLQGALPALAPVDTLVDAMWRRAKASTPDRKSTAPTLAKGFWRRFSLPQLAPMRPTVRALALILFALGLVQGPLGQTAEAQTSLTAP
ncbi:hypothetical protein NX862_04380 [Rhodobacter sp. KR11]|uniref:hypothetical protein n=1 Tax=Rhodobacter sp. KR11 TaxID=2974588 RepID=UPI002222E4B3|nr:hypothetical protein [Rhodobacter sp. KR11]MCW1917981.1 hypothetical protein [Rhodobacter sp. KR11]